MIKKVRIGAGSGFWGDGIDPAIELLEHGNLDYMCFDYLAELTMSLLERQRQRKPESGYVPDFVDHAKAMLQLARDKHTRLISNGGGVNPMGAARLIVDEAKRLGMGALKVAVVTGDDVLGQLDTMQAEGVTLQNTDTGQADFGRVRHLVVSANVYTDCSGIVEGLGAGADIVVTGRVSDNALYVGPIMHEFGWKHDHVHVDKIAAAITAGHILECACPCTGGMSSRFASMPRMGMVGFPYVDFAQDATAEISKLFDTGGVVDIDSVREHLVYEIADPRRYLMPDGIADFTSLRLEQTAANRVKVSGVTGAAPPEMLKLVIGYQDGWIGESMAFFPWPHAYDRALKARQTMLERLERMGLQADEIQFDFVGLNMLHGPAAGEIDPVIANSMPEIGLRCAVRTRTVQEAEKVRRASANLWTMGPSGTAFGSPIKPRPVVALWPTLVPRKYVRQSVQMLES
ncbi:hypothetical protein AKG08_25235 [Achromobacter piechaudii]|uniref:acyclic terpene utilization AtuA family protein n=1 Tax=Achromobacter piechaudii TaxID=72556 RepID=UPI000681CE07|nr:acyclic terpene utilization AtuA family protein [Achromobacter piechaudii]KNY05681.1 hypothetical protein AKG08_25235 [Achromobacter piechaudii]CAB3925201.1 hypothetical protein LMG2828_05958 [Achromobacter piechaudii]CAB3955726.1 hypothetical protein LMG6103_04605 [Achromobacter piechaudii]